MSRRPLLATALLTLATGAWSAEGPLLDVAIADGAKLVTDWNASIYAKLWNDPALAGQREKVDANLAQMEHDLGFKPFDVLAALKQGGLRIVEVVRDQGGAPAPRLIALGDLGQYAEQITQIVRGANPNGIADRPLPGVSEAFSIEGKNTLIARFKQMLMLSMQGQPTDLVPWTPAAAGTADVLARVDGKRYIDALNKLLPPGTLDPAATARLQTTWDFHVRLVPEGMEERIVMGVPPTGGQPVDRTLLTRLPAESLLVAAVGFDGAASWKEQRNPLLGALAARMGLKDADAVEQQLDQQLAATGLTCTVKQLVEGFKGTGLLAITPGAPFPAVSLALPRSPALDQVVALGLTALQVAMPDVGTSALLPIPNLPVAVQFGRDQTHWLISSDANLPTTWFAGQPGGWADSPAGRQALGKAPKQAFLIGASNTPALLRTIAGFLPMGLAANPNLEAKDRQTIMQMIAKAAVLAAPGWLACYGEAQTTVIEDRGLLGISALTPLGAIGLFATAGRAAGGNDALAANVLRAAVFPAEIQFQGGAFVDQDGDGVGEFGFLSEMGGLRATQGLKAGQMSLVDPELAAGGPQHGYRFTVFLPDDAGGAMTEPAGNALRQANKTAAKAQTTRFVAYAWPATPEAGRVMLAVNASGQLFSAPATGAPPVWNALFGGKGWEAPPVWAPYQAPGRRRGGNAGAPAPGAGPGEF